MIPFIFLYSISSESSVFFKTMWQTNHGRKLSDVESLIPVVNYVSMQNLLTANTNKNDKRLIIGVLTVQSNLMLLTLQW